jgi:hypothetical protein
MLRSTFRVKELGLASGQSQCWRVHGFLGVCSGRHVYRCGQQTPRNKVFPEKLLVPQLGKKSSTFHGGRKFITVSTAARHFYRSFLDCLVLEQDRYFSRNVGTKLPFDAAYTTKERRSQINPVQKQPIPFLFSFIQIICSHRCLGLQSVLFPSGFPTRPLYVTVPTPHMPHASPISSTFI